jgi:cell division protein FtsZ
MIHTNGASLQELQPRIVVFGVGGAGGNAVNNMIEANLQGVEFVVANTDAQALTRAKTPHRIQLGASITEGLGAGARPEVGQAAAQESAPEIVEFLDNAHMVFVAAGMGGGTGTGAAPVIARAARERGILTVAVVTKPFHFEGQRRMALAEQGVQELRKHVDTLIVIPNQNLFRIANDRTTFAEAFTMADQVLYSGVRGITDLMVMPGLINLDFADVRTVMAEMGTAMMGTGEGEGPSRGLEAAHGAIQNPLLDIVSMKGAKGLLINITGGFDMTLYEVDAAANEIRAEVDPNCNIIMGSTFDETMRGRMRVSVVATGIDDEAVVSQKTIVPAARKAAEGVVGAPAARRAAASDFGETALGANATPAGPPPREAIPDAAYEEARPMFRAEDADPDAAERRKSGFRFFGWARQGQGETSGAAGPAGAPPPSGTKPATDPPADAELEIPAFLRRQIHPR